MNEINDLEPTSLKHIIGQTHVVETLSVAIDAAFADNKPLDSCLIVSPPGLGKSALCSALQHEMAVSECHSYLAQAITNLADLNALLLKVPENEMLILDECHLLPHAQQTALLLALDRRQIFVSGSNSVQALAIANFTLVLATSEEAGIISPLIDRLKIILRLQYYSHEELTQIVWHRCRSLGWEVDPRVVPEIAERGRGTPRLALRLLQSARRCTRAEGETSITLDHLRRACELEQIDHRGLDITQQQYLKLLGDGPMRLNVLASILGLAPPTVSKKIESYLLRDSLIYKDDQGRRQLTAKGHEHLAGLPTDST